VVPGIRQGRVQAFAGEGQEQNLGQGHGQEKDVCDDEGHDDPLDRRREQGVDGADEVGAESGEAIKNYMVQWLHWIKLHIELMKGTSLTHSLSVSVSLANR